MYVAFLDDGAGFRTRNENRVAVSMRNFDCSFKKAGKIAARQWNLNLIRQINSRTLAELTGSEVDAVPKVELLKKLSSGTSVVWQELFGMIQGDDAAHKMSEKMEVVRGHLSLFFHRYLPGICRKTRAFMFTATKG